MKLTGFLLFVLVALGCLTWRTEAQNCRIKYRGKWLNFGSKCTTFGGIKVYWKVNRAKKKLTTVLSAKTTGYIAFGWGYNGMIGGVAAVGYVWNDKAFWRFYNLNGKSTSQVVPVPNMSPKRGSYNKNREILTVKYDVGLSRFARIRPGRTNNVIWSVGTPQSPTALTRHTNRGVGVVNL